MDIIIITTIITAIKEVNITITTINMIMIIIIIMIINMIINIKIIIKIIKMNT